MMDITTRQRLTEHYRSSPLRPSLFGIATVIAIVVLFISMLALVSCASTTRSDEPITTIDGETIAANPTSTGANRVYAQYAQSLATSARIYEATMIASGEAHGSGLISDSQLEQIRTIGAQVQSALLLAKSALQVYSSTGDLATGRTLSERMLEYDRLLLQLRDIAQQGGVF